MFAIIFLSVALVLLTTLVHLAFFSLLTRNHAPKTPLSHGHFYILMIALFAVHVVDIALYAAGYYLASDVLALGALEGDRAGGVMGHFYASAVIYTTLGFGDVLPSDHLRCMTAVEALNGLLFIAWSASFMFASMGRLHVDLGRQGAAA